MYTGKVSPILRGKFKLSEDKSIHYTEVAKNKKIKIWRNHKSYFYVYVGEKDAGLKCPFRL